MLGDIVKSCCEKAQGQQKSEGYIKLEREFATIPLPGMDVPLHFRYLWAGVMPSHACKHPSYLKIHVSNSIFADLSKKINPTHLNPDMLVGKYIPNLIAKPFQISREYAQIFYDQTSSPRLDKVLKKWEKDNWASANNRQQLAYTILVELPWPVRWIETQDPLFTSFKFERLVELGPSPTLTGMATRTLKAKYEILDGSISRTCAILCHSKNVKKIYY